MMSEKTDDPATDAVPEPSAKVEEGTSTTPVAEESGGSTFSYQSKYLPYIGQFLSGLVLLIAITSAGGKSQVKNWAYGIAASTVAMFFSLVGLVLVMKNVQTTVVSHERTGDVTITKALDGFNFIWWFVAACIMTFNGPFLITSNGYFASWAGLVFSVAGLGVTQESVTHNAPTGDKSTLVGLGAASIIIIIALSIGNPSYFGTDAPHRGESIFAIVIACLTLVFALVWMVVLSQRGQEMNLNIVVLALLACAWICVGCVTTFRGPFELTGNGYFAAWFGCILSVMATFTAYQTMRNRE